MLHMKGNGVNMGRLKLVKNGRLVLDSIIPRRIAAFAVKQVGKGGFLSGNFFLISFNFGK